MAITDLTGYTWVGNSNVTVTSASVRTYNINYSITCDDTQYNSSGGTLLKISFTQEYHPPRDINLSIAYIEIDTDNYYFFGGLFYQATGRIYESKYNDTLPATLSLTNNTSASYVTSITFTGGADVTNPTLISWLEANGTLTAPAPSGFSIDLTSLTGWDSLSTGTHNIQVKAKATGYLDSDLSESVSVEKQASGYKVNIKIDTASGYGSLASAGGIYIYDDFDDYTYKGNLLASKTTNIGYSENFEVTTTTGKLFVFLKSDDYVATLEPIVSNNITTAYVIRENIAFIVNGDGTITISGVDWDD